jgi:hypothetical protein
MKIAAERIIHGIVNNSAVKIRAVHIIFKSFANTPKFGFALKKFVKNVFFAENSTYR